jgi:hypothetical protein
MDPTVLQWLFKYALAIARQRDDQQELGEIHLLKYAYLADLAHASRNGTTLSGVPWRFHKFGPWNEEAWQNIPPAMEALPVEVRTFAYEKDGLEGEAKRWRIPDANEADRIIREAERVLPGWAATQMRRWVREFGNDTSSLLHHVYLSEPMLRAAPGERLVFDELPPPAAPESTEAAAPLTPRQKRKQHEKMKSGREAVLEKLRRRQERRAKRVAYEPRYDEVYAEGVRWLDSLAGAPLDGQSGTLTFSEEVWRSRGRGDPSIP